MYADLAARKRVPADLPSSRTTIPIRIDQGKALDYVANANSVILFSPALNAPLSLSGAKQSYQRCRSAAEATSLKPVDSAEETRPAILSTQCASGCSSNLDDPLLCPFRILRHDVTLCSWNLHIDICRPPAQATFT